MRWFQRRKHESEEALQAVNEAQKHLDEIRNRSAEVRREAKIQRQIAERNHFIDQMTIIFGGDGKK